MIFQCLRSDRCDGRRFALIAIYPTNLQSRPTWVVARSFRDIILRERDLKRTSALNVISGTFQPHALSEGVRFNSEHAARSRYGQVLEACKRRRNRWRSQ